MTMTEPESVSTEKLRSFASSAPPCISLVLPEHEARDARIALKDVLAKLRARLTARLRGNDVAMLLEPLETAARDLLDSSKEPATLIFMRSRDVIASFRTRYLIGQSVATFGECFQLRPLLALAGKHLEFYILALKLNDTRIFKCTDQNCEAAGFPGSAGGDLHARPVHDRDHPETHLGHYYREVDRHVNALLKNGHPPLVVTGVEHEVAHFHRLTTYPACVAPGIFGLLDEREMYRRSLNLVRSVTTGQARRALEKFDKQIGTRHASTNVQEIVHAASNGRVEHLILMEDAAIPQEVDGGADRLNTAAVQTLRHGGDVHTLPRAAMPSAESVCAIFRYASSHDQA